MSNLSPAAQAVYDAFWAAFDLDGSKDLGAALRAAVEQVVPDAGDLWDCCDHRAVQVRRDLLAIATELETHE